MVGITNYKYSATASNVVCLCCSCFRQYDLYSCTSIPGKPCNDYTAEKGHKMLIACEDDKIYEMAMRAAERALSTIRIVIFGDVNVIGGKHFYVKGDIYISIFVAVKLIDNISFPCF
ncbi:hypothetical protein MtrunA17_Chr5g0410691 [Medicago truncatula]|nr:hypothetical protein MtrunA17_Chr5g0410691 [Medicago truncatula]